MRALTIVFTIFALAAGLTVALAAGPATAPTTRPTSQPAAPPSTQPEAMVPAAALRDANAKLDVLREQLRDAYRQINELQDQLAALRNQTASAAPPPPPSRSPSAPPRAAPAPGSSGGSSPGSAGLGPTILTVEGRSLREGMSVDQVSGVCVRVLGWEGPQQLEKTGDETVYRWRKWKTTEGDKYHAQQRVSVASLTCTFKSGKLVSCKWTA